MLSRASDKHYTSQNIGRRMHGPSPHLEFFGGPSSPVPPRSPPMRESETQIEKETERAHCKINRERDRQTGRDRQRGTSGVARGSGGSKRPRAPRVGAPK